MDAKKMREKANAATCDNIFNLIEDRAEKGDTEVEISDYEHLYITEECESLLIEKGFVVDGSTIRW